jgi:lactate dehydrogenase-like 2-hydroxyacid dehydrogenase
MFDKLILTDFTDADFPEDLWIRLRGCAREIVMVSQQDLNFRAEVSSADGLVLRLGMAADSFFQDSAPLLRYIGMFGTGYGRIDTDHARNRGIVVTNVANYTTRGVTEFVVGATLQLLRNLCQEVTRGSNGDASETNNLGAELGSLVAGVIGAGFIGKQVARTLSQGFGTRVLYSSRHRQAELDSLPNSSYSQIDDLLEMSDLVTLHLAANQQTENTLDTIRINRMKRGAVLVNTAPNELLDLDAVVQRCADGDLAFIMDHADELSGAQYSRLQRVPNVYIYPPIGYATADSQKRKWEVLVSNIECYLAGNPQNQVNSLPLRNQLRPHGGLPLADD